MEAGEKTLKNRDAPSLGKALSNHSKFENMWQPWTEIKSCQKRRVMRQELRLIEFSKGCSNSFFEDYNPNGFGIKSEQQGILERT